MTATWTSLGLQVSLIQWGRVTHICVDELTIIGSDNSLSPGRRQAITWTNVVILLIGSLGTNVSEIWSGIQTFSFKKMHLKMSSAKWRPSCLALNVLTLIVIKSSECRSQSSDFVKFKLFIVNCDSYRWHQNWKATRFVSLISHNFNLTSIIRMESLTEILISSPHSDRYLDIVTIDNHC